MRLAYSNDSPVGDSKQNCRTVQRDTGLLLEHLPLCPVNGFATVGCPVKVGDDNQLVVLIASKVVKVLADGEGLRQFFQVKGASGIRC